MTDFWESIWKMLHALNAFRSSRQKTPAKDSARTSAGTKKKTADGVSFAQYAAVQSSAAERVTRELRLICRVEGKSMEAPACTGQGAGAFLAAMASRNA